MRLDIFTWFCSNWSDLREKFAANVTSNKEVPLHFASHPDPYLDPDTDQILAGRGMRCFCYRKFTSRYLLCMRVVLWFYVNLYITADHCRVVHNVMWSLWRWLCQTVMGSCWIVVVKLTLHALCRSICCTVYCLSVGSKAIVFHSAVLLLRRWWREI